MSFVRLASGVALFATASGLLVRTPKGWARIGLGDRHRESALVERLARGAMAITAQDKSIARVLLGKDLLVATADTPTAGAVPSFPEHVLIGAPDDATMGMRLAERVRARRPSLVLWIDERGIAAAYDDGAARGCPLCAWSWDSAAARYVTPTGDLAGAPRAFADAEHFALRAVRVVEEAHALDSSCVWTISSPNAEAVTTSIAPHPSCPCAVRPVRARAAAWSPPADWEAARRRHAPVWPMDSGDESVARVVFRRSRSPWSTHPGALGVALGTGADPRAAALGEAIERFAMLHAPPTWIERAAEALEVPALEPALVRELLFREEEYVADGFRFRRYDPSEAQDWSIASSLATGEERAVPASIVGRARAGTRSFTDATSNGYAAHHDRDRAIDGALLELVERDALLLDAYTPTRELLRLVDAGGPRGCSTFLVTQDVELPVVLALKIRADGVLRVGSAAGTTLDSAGARAHAELAVALAGSATERPARALDDVRSRFEPDDHLAALRGAAASTMLAAMGARSRSLPCSAVRSRWPGASSPRALIVGALATVGLEPWIVDRSLPGIFGEGWHVVRALVPGLVELSWGLPYRRLASRRMTARLAAGAHLSTSPHPIA